MVDGDARLYKKRKVIYWVSTISLALSWYIVTGIESCQMGLHPLTRRFFSWFDALYFILILVVIIFLDKWYRKCPKCGHKMIERYSPKCLNCKFGYKE
ncbi:MAG: hypothetical protein AB1498_12415 [bacterium]